jgi:hypothetical protein
VADKPTVKRIPRVPDEWPTWPFTKLSPEVMRQLCAKLDKRKREHDERQREYAREQAIQHRRGTRQKA